MITDIDGANRPGWRFCGSDWKAAYCGESSADHHGAYERLEGREENKVIKINEQS